MQLPYGSWVDAPTVSTEQLAEPEEFTSGRFRTLLRRIEAQTAGRGGRLLQQLSLRLALLWVSFSIAIVMTRYTAGAILRRFR